MILEFAEFPVLDFVALQMVLEEKRKEKKKKRNVKNELKSWSPSNLPKNKPEILGDSWVWHSLTKISKMKAEKMIKKKKITTLVLSLSLGLTDVIACDGNWGTVSMFVKEKKILFSLTWVYEA